MTSVLIHNFGCRVNQAEAFGWAEEFQSRGLRLEKDITRSDLVVVNTCTLTNRAESDVRRYLRRVTRLNPSARLVLTGCSVALDRARFEGGPQVWLVVPNEDKAHLADRVLALVGAAPARPIEPFRSRALINSRTAVIFVAPSASSRPSGAEDGASRPPKSCPRSGVSQSGASPRSSFPEFSWARTGPTSSRERPSSNSWRRWRRRRAESASG